jgi:hypothetical protein
MHKPFTAEEFQHTIDQASDLHHLLWGIITGFMTPREREGDLEFWDVIMVRSDDAEGTQGDVDRASYWHGTVDMLYAQLSEVYYARAVHVGFHEFPDERKTLGEKLANLSAYIANWPKTPAEFARILAYFDRDEDVRQDFSLRMPANRYPEAATEPAEVSITYILWKGAPKQRDKEGDAHTLGEEIQRSYREATGSFDRFIVRNRGHIEWILRTAKRRPDK